MDMPLNFNLSYSKGLMLLSAYNHISCVRWKELLSDVLGFSEIQYFPASLWIGAKHYGSFGILQKLAWLVLKP